MIDNCHYKHQNKGILMSKNCSVKCQFWLFKCLNLTLGHNEIADCYYGPLTIMLLLDYSSLRLLSSNTKIWQIFQNCVNLQFGLINWSKPKILSLQNITWVLTLSWFYLYLKGLNTRQCSDTKTNKLKASCLQLHL